MKKISLVAIVIFLIFISVSWVSAQTVPVYSPLVKIPGIDPGANLTQYLSGLFNFVIAVVGILAMAMIIYGGMRYLTSVGNPTIAEDGKDAILSAIYGLILALSAWVIIYVVNPDILILKKPGVKLPTSAFDSSNKDNFCVRGPGTGTAASPCRCIDGAVITSTSPNNSNCQEICLTPSLAAGGKYHCLKAVMKAVATTGLEHDQFKLLAKEYTTPDNPLTIPNGSRIAWDGLDYTVAYPTFPNLTSISFCFDGLPSPGLSSSNGICDGGERGTGSARGSQDLYYDDAKYKSNCQTIRNPASVQCRFRYMISDPSGAYSETDLYVRILEPQ